MSRLPVKVWYAKADATAGRLGPFRTDVEAAARVMVAGYPLPGAYYWPEMVDPATVPAHFVTRGRKKGLRPEVRERYERADVFILRVLQEGPTVHAAILQRITKASARDRGPELFSYDVSDGIQRLRREGKIRYLKRSEISKASGWRHGWTIVPAADGAEPAS